MEETMEKMDDMVLGEPTHPGELLREELLERRLSQKIFAEQLGIQKSYLNELIKGKRNFNSEIALKIEEVLEIPAEIWMNMQVNYDIEKTSYELQLTHRKTSINKKDAQNDLHVTTNKKYDFEKSFASDAALNYLSAINIVEEGSYAYYRISNKLDTNLKNLLAWQSLVEEEAALVSLPKFKSESIVDLIDHLNGIFCQNCDTLAKVEKTLNQWGIKFVLQEKLHKTPIDGCSFWSGSNPVIAMTLRHKRLDNFAFTLFHELGHIYLHISKDRELKFLDGEDFKKDVYENEADDFAQEALIPEKIWKEIFEKGENTTLTDIRSYGAKYGIHPSIIIGRLQYETKNYSKFNREKKNIE